MRIAILAVASTLLSVVISARGATPEVFESEDTPAALIELFTSEGCSSCPTADAWFTGLKSNPGLWKQFVPVAFHVDYWNSIGWVDRFSTAANSARQRRYAAAWNSHSVYTPGLVLNGREWPNWFERRNFPGPSSARAGRLKLVVSDAGMEIAFTPAGNRADSPFLLAEVAFLASNLASNVTQGENRGRRLQHDFTVVHFISIPLPLGNQGYRATIPRPAKFGIVPDAIAAWVKAGEALPPIQATGGWLIGD